MLEQHINTKKKIYKVIIPVFSSGSGHIKISLIASSVLVLQSDVKETRSFHMTFEFPLSFLNLVIIAISDQKILLKSFPHHVITKYALHFNLKLFPPPLTLCRINLFNFTSLHGSVATQDSKEQISLSNRGRKILGSSKTIAHCVMYATFILY